MWECLLPRSDCFVEKRSPILLEIRTKEEYMFIIFFQFYVLNKLAR